MGAGVVALSREFAQADAVLAPRLRVEFPREKGYTEIVKSSPASNSAK